jgi:hypothetical protein
VGLLILRRDGGLVAPTPSIDSRYSFCTTACWFSFCTWKVASTWYSFCTWWRHFLYLGNVFRFACYPLAISHPVWVFGGARYRCDLFGLFDSFDFLPGISYLFVRTNGAAEIIEQEGVGLPVFRVG